MSLSTHHSAATKEELDRRVATRLRIPRKQVKAITYAFIEALREVLTEEGLVAVPRLGSLRVTVAKINKTRVLSNSGFTGTLGKKQRVHVKEEIRVHFSKSRQLDTELKGSMEKINGKARCRRVG